MSSFSSKNISLTSIPSGLGPPCSVLLIEGCRYVGIRLWRVGDVSASSQWWYVEVGQEIPSRCLYSFLFLMSYIPGTPNVFSVFCCWLIEVRVLRGVLVMAPAPCPVSS